MGIRSFVSRIVKSFGALSPVSWLGGGGWLPVIREPFAGAWQRNLECSPETVIGFAPVFACITRIATDIGKMRFILQQEDKDGIYNEVKGNSPFWPVLRKPNHYQTHIDFKESWLISKLRTGNTFVLKQRDNRGVVTALYILDPLRVQPLVATDGSIFYRLAIDNLSGIEEGGLVVPASEIIHDRMNCLFHPLIGISPLFACALSAGVGLEINKNSGRFFMNGAKISGVISVPGNIGDAAATDLTNKFNAGYTGENAGKIAVLGDNMKFTQLTMTSVDAQLSQQLSAYGLDVCTVYHVPPHKVGIGQMPSYDNIEALNQQYYSECLQSPIEKMEQLLEEGLAIPSTLDVCLDIDCLLRMDQKTQMETLEKGKNIMTPNEQRKKLGLAPVTGGNAVYRQQQDFSLEALSKRDSLPDPFVIDRPTTNPTPGGGPNDTGSATQIDPNVGKDLEVLEGEFEVIQMIRSQMAPLKVLPPPLEKAA
jgi:HK97 family phage portal protein